MFTHVLRGKRAINVLLFVLCLLLEPETQLIQRGAVRIIRSSPRNNNLTAASKQHDKQLPASVV